MRQVIHACGLKLSTLSTAPPKVTNTNCSTKIDRVTFRKFLLRFKFSNGLIWLVLALNPLNVIAIIKVANTADLRYVLKSEAKRS